MEDGWKSKSIGERGAPFINTTTGKHFLAEGSEDGHEPWIVKWDSGFIEVVANERFVAIFAKVDLNTQALVEQDYLGSMEEDPIDDEDACFAPTHEDEDEWAMFDNANTVLESEFLRAFRGEEEDVEQDKVAPVGEKDDAI